MGWGWGGGEVGGFGVGLGVRVGMGLGRDSQGWCAAQKCKTWPTMSVVQIGNASSGGQLRAPVQRPLAINSVHSHPSHSEMTIAAAGAPWLMSSTQPRVAARHSARCGHEGSFSRRSSSGAATKSRSACKHSTAVIASGAPSNPRLDSSVLARRTCTRLEAMLITIGARTQRCATRNRLMSVEIARPGRPSRRSQMKRVALVTTRLGWPTARRMSGAAAARGSEKQQMTHRWSSTMRCKSSPTLR